MLNKSILNFSSASVASVRLAIAGQNQALRTPDFDLASLSRKLRILTDAFLRPEPRLIGGFLPGAEIGEGSFPAVGKGRD